MEDRLTFTIAPDTRTHDSQGRGLEMGKYSIICRRNGNYSGGLLVTPDVAYAHAKRMMLDGWVPEDAQTRSFVDGMRNVERAFEEDAKRAHLYDERGRLKPVFKQRRPPED